VSVFWRKPESHYIVLKRGSENQENFAAFFGNMTKFFCIKPTIIDPVIMGYGQKKFKNVKRVFFRNPSRQKTTKPTDKNVI